MIEIEVKVKIPKEKTDIEKKLLELGAEFVGIEKHVDIYYNSPQRDFSKTDEALRIRNAKSEHKNVENIITYKGPKIDSESKTRKEIEIKIDDENSADEILKALGFRASGRVDKTRKNYKLKEIYVSLDDVEWLGKFMELEIDSVKEDFELEKKRIFKVLKSFGFKKDDVIRESYLEMLKEIRKA